ncbi:hypothetical protein EU527_12925 [Candidatus Thorarchaeota archaeon]|nr:MAG: hypothetical protein EU527_12925 [Candidatus Thorarchaeota archaeon]
MKLRALVLLSLISITVIASSSFISPIAEDKEISDVKVLMLICDGFGWNYFDAKERLEDWGVSVTTISNSLDTNISSCINKPNNWTIADYLLMDVEDDIVAQFDILYIPSGAQWQSLISSTRVRNFISNAYKNGLIISTLCIGNRVLSEANDIVNGTNVASYPNANTYMFVAGATIRYGVDVVSDNRLITGGTGGGVYTGGNTEAPTSEVCMTLIKEALGYSYISKATISPSSGESGTNFTLTIEVDDLDEKFHDLLSVDINITKVIAKVLTKENRTLIESIELTDDDSDSIYVGSIIGTFEEEFVIDFEIEDTNSTLEIERELVSFSVGKEPITTYMSTFTGVYIVLIGMIGGVSLVVLSIIVVILKKH